MIRFHAIGLYFLQMDWHTVVLVGRSFCTWRALTSVVAYAFFWILAADVRTVLVRAEDLALFHRYLFLFTFLAPGAPPIVYPQSSTVAIRALAPHTKVLAEAYTTTMFAFVATLFMDTEFVLVVHNLSGRRRVEDTGVSRQGVWSGGVAEMVVATS